MIAAIGSSTVLAGLALAGVQVAPAEDADAACAALAALPPETALVLLTPQAERALAAMLAARSDLLWTVVG